MMCAQPIKETRPAEEVITAFLSFRQADRAQVINSRSTVVALARCRQELMWLLRDLTLLSFDAIGQHLGRRDQTTIKHGVEVVADRIAESEGYRREMQFLRKKILLATGFTALTPDLCLTAVRSILTNGALTDADARKAAMQMIEVRHG